MEFFKQNATNSRSTNLVRLNLLKTRELPRFKRRQERTELW